MTSEKKAQANRQNALKSTGPKTPEGKDAVRLNAMKHGLLCQEVLLPGEDEEALRELSEHLWIELKLVGEMEPSKSTESSPPTGGFVGWVGSRRAYSLGSATRNWPSGRSVKPRDTIGSY